MDDAWWGASVPRRRRAATRRSCSASGPCRTRSSSTPTATGSPTSRESYVDLGHHMLEHDETVPGPFWLITDARHARRYLRSFAMDPQGTKAMRRPGIMVKARHARRPRRCDRRSTRPASRRRSSGSTAFARTGVDDDFGRGNSAYDRYYGDPLVQPNPNLGPLEKGPFTAVQLVPGDLGTKGGLRHRRRRAGAREDGTVDRRASTRPATTPPPSWAAPTPDRDRPSARPSCSAPRRPPHGSRRAVAGQHLCMPHDPGRWKASGLPPTFTSRFHRPGRELLAQGSHLRGCQSHVLLAPQPAHRCRPPDRGQVERDEPVRDGRRDGDRAGHADGLQADGEAGLGDAHAAGDAASGRRTGSPRC